MERDGGDLRMSGYMVRLGRERTVERHLVTPAFCTAAMGEGFGKKLKEPQSWSSSAGARTLRVCALRPLSAEEYLFNKKEQKEGNNH